MVWVFRFSTLGLPHGSSFSANSALESLVLQGFSGPNPLVPLVFALFLRGQCAQLAGFKHQVEVFFVALELVSRLNQLGPPIELLFQGWSRGVDARDWANQGC